MQRNLQVDTETVRVTRVSLLEALEKNRVKHLEEYKVAIVQFRKDVIEEMTAILEKNKKGDKIRLALKENVREPASYELEYDKAIRKYSMSVDEHIFLDDTQFDKYIMDNWAWKHALSNSFYSEKSSIGASR